MITGTCHLCGGSFAREYVVREMMMGTREAFPYGECGSCGSLQLLRVPDDLGAHYPPSYYSFSAPRRESGVRLLGKRLRAAALVRGHKRAARAIGRGAELPAWHEWLAVTGLDRSASILDVGSGSGALLLDLKAQGFTRLAGADAFIAESMVTDGIPIAKAGPMELEGSYDLIMLNHSFEHMPDPLGTLKALGGHLTARGWIMVRVPVAGSPIWDEYGSDWESIDAPRHLYLPTHKGMACAAEAAGLRLERTLHETSVVQFWRSEQYRQGIPLTDERAHERNPAASGFTAEQIADWRRRAQELNAAGQSAAAAFFLRPAA